MSTPKALGKGISRTPHGYRAAIRIDGELHRRRFPPDTDPLEMRQWLLKTEMRHRGKHGQRTGRFEDDARAYLASVAALATFDQRRQHIEEWIAVFGQRRRDSLTSAEITAQLHEWRTVPRTIQQRGGTTRHVTLSAAAVNKRRTALMHLFSVLDGKAERNPVRDVPRFLEPSPAPRALPFEVLARVFAAMPDSRSKAHLMVLAYTGIPPKQIANIRPEAVTAATVAVEGRSKGKGTRGRIVPLIPQAVEAFALMRRLNAWGPVRVFVMRRVFARARKAAGVEGSWRVYDLRHSFGSEVYRRSGDIRATQILMGHSSPVLTHRYTMSAEDPRVTAAIKAFD